VTESEWLACADPQPMLEFLQGKANERKLRLFAVSCCFRIMPLLVDSRSRTAVELAERFAEGTGSLRELCSAGEAADGLWNETALGDDDRFDDAGTDAVEAAANCTYPDNAGEAARMTAHSAVSAMSYSGRQNSEQQAQADLLRDSFGNPFRPVVLNSTWRTPTVTALATAAYEERHLPAGTLDTQRLAILADALEDAGCTDEQILAHLRGPGPHVRGCWVVDLLLGKE
jgi:hypothetical protein